jgi:hypothetical protein
MMIAEARDIMSEGHNSGHELKSSIVRLCCRGDNDEAGGIQELCHLGRRCE